MTKLWTRIFTAITFLTVAVGSTYACTGIKLTATDGSVVRGRTMEFASDLKSAIIVIPRHYKMQGSTPDGKKGVAWTTKYAACGANAIGLPALCDGINEKGLSAGVFFFKGYAKYPAFNAAMQDRTLMSWELLSWILTNCASIEEVKQEIDNIQVCGGMVRELNCELPLHYAVYEPNGKAVVLEYLNGKLHIFDNPVGSITNNPEFPWHLTNLCNYVSLSPYNKSSSLIASLNVSPLGMGSGMIGLPGDFTPPSRFVRATLLANAAFPGPNGLEAVKQAFHVLRSFDIPMGAIREKGQDNSDHNNVEITQWTVVCDLNAKKFYYWTHDDSTIRMCDLEKCNLDNNRIVGLPMNRPEQIDDITTRMK